MNLNRNERKSAVIGMIIGDGCLSKHIKDENNNAYYQMTHCTAQYDYMIWKKEILDPISHCKIWRNDSKLNDKVYESYRLYSKTNPVYTKLYNRFYGYGKKSVDEYLVKMITPLALAIIYMDDGCCGKAISENWQKEVFYLCLHNFDYANLFLIKKSLKIKFDLDWNINKTSKKYYQLRLLIKHNQKFVDIISPYVNQVPCMIYKLGSYAGTSSDVDIV